MPSEFCLSVGSIGTQPPPRATRTGCSFEVSVKEPFGLAVTCAVSVVKESTTTGLPVERAFAAASGCVVACRGAGFVVPFVAPVLGAALFAGLPFALAAGLDVDGDVDGDADGEALAAFAATGARPRVMVSAPTTAVASSLRRRGTGLCRGMGIVLNGIAVSFIRGPGAEHPGRGSWSGQ